MWDDKNLFDSGVLLEVLLDQERAVLCRKVIEDHADSLTITDFSLHAIGLILLRNKRQDLYQNFFRDLAPRLHILSLPVESYDTLLDYHTRFNLDFDDAYQACTASLFGLKLLTLDSDFARVKEIIDVTILR
jgi:predicted nucleic acid-binding protein